MKSFRFAILPLILALSVVQVKADAGIRPGDTFELKIGGVPGADVGIISSTYTVDGEGYVNLSYIGRVQVAGMNPGQIQSSIEHSYVSQGIFTHPTISLNIAPSSRLVTVGGEVKAPGRVPYTPDMTIMSAIGAAGDFTMYADQGRVRLLRGGGVKIFNCKKMRGNPSLDEKVLPGDNIQVPQGFF